MAFVRESMATGGESRCLSLIMAGSLTHAAVGGESAGGIGNPELDVCQNIASGSMTLSAIHPGGRAGGVMLSKLSNKEQAMGMGVGVGVEGVAVGGLPSQNPRIWKTWSGET